jgi:hypothetical protein
MHTSLSPGTTGKTTTLSSNKKTAPLSVNSYDRLEEQALKATVSTPLVPVRNSFMPTQKLTSKTRVGSKKIKVYDEPRSPFQRLLESGELSRKRKDALATQCALYNPVQLQQHINKAILRLRQRLAQANRVQTQEQE